MAGCSLDKSSRDNCNGILYHPCNLASNFILQTRSSLYERCISSAGYGAVLSNGGSRGLGLVSTEYPGNPCRRKVNKH
jgi:hypothetical protein